MPIRHRGKQRIPLDLEPPVMEKLESSASQCGINRTRLARILIKYGLANLSKAIEYGDRIIWNPKPTTEDISDGTPDNPDID